ncbi:hypothetical protein ACP4OV_013794 [Aristida adscensionis]
MAWLRAAGGCRGRDRLMWPARRVLCPYYGRTGHVANRFPLLHACFTPPLHCTARPRISSTPSPASPPVLCFAVPVPGRPGVAIAVRSSAATNPATPSDLQLPVTVSDIARSSHTYVAHVLLPLFLRPVARFAASVAGAGGPAAAAAAILHRAGALPRNRGLERLVRGGGGGVLHGGGHSCIASLVVGVMRCLC